MHTVASQMPFCSNYNIFFAHQNQEQWSCHVLILHQISENGFIGIKCGYIKLRILFLLWKACSTARHLLAFFLFFLTSAFSCDANNYDLSVIAREMILDKCKYQNDTICFCFLPLPQHNSSSSLRRLLHN
jgi:hypothetical protein